MSEPYERDAIMAAAQALAEAAGGDRVGQGDLRDAEKVIVAATCSRTNDCSFWKGHEGECSAQLIAKLDRGQRAEGLLEAIIENDAPMLREVAADFLKER